MFHLEIYSSSVTNGSLLQATAFTPSVIPKLNNGFQVPTLRSVMAVAGVSTNLQRIQLQAPSLRPYPYPDFVAVNRGSVFESPVRHVDYSRMPLPLNYTEELDMFVAQNGSAAQSVYGGVVFCDGPVTPSTGARIFTVHATASVTLTAGTWSLTTPALDQALPAGMYNLVGARVYSATALFFRIYPNMGPVWRPGATAVQAYDGLEIPAARYGQWGTWLSFQQNVFPQVEVFATAADTAEEYWFDLMYAGAAPGGQAS